MCTKQLAAVLAQKEKKKLKQKQKQKEKDEKNQKKKEEKEKKKEELKKKKDEKKKKKEAEKECKKAHLPTGKCGTSCATKAKASKNQIFLQLIFCFIFDILYLVKYFAYIKSYKGAECKTCLENLGCKVPAGMGEAEDEAKEDGKEGQEDCKKVGGCKDDLTKYCRVCKAKCTKARVFRFLYIFLKQFFLKVFYIEFLFNFV